MKVCSNAKTCMSLKGQSTTWCLGKCVASPSISRCGKNKPLCQWLLKVSLVDIWILVVYDELSSDVFYRKSVFFTMYQMILYTHERLDHRWLVEIRTNNTTYKKHHGTYPRFHFLSLLTNDYHDSFHADHHCLIQSTNDVILLKLAHHCKKQTWLNLHFRFLHHCCEM